MDRIGFGIVGCGMIAGFHARAIADVPGAFLAGATSSRRESAEAFVAERGGRAYDSLEAMLADDAVQVVCVCTPSGSHLDPAVAAARAGRHVVVEKPLEITLARCDAIIDACEAAGVTLTTIFPSRFHEAALAMRRAVEAGRFGRLTLGGGYVKWYRTQAYYDGGAWRGTWELDGGGALMNQAIHTVDLLSWLMGPVAEITAQAATLAHERIAVEDAAVATLRFASGALGILEATTAAYPGMLKRVELSGSDGTAVLEEENIKAWTFREARPEDADLVARLAAKTATGGGAGDPKAIGHHGHAAQLADTVAAIREGRKPRIDGSEGRRAVEIILAIYQAAETGRAVELPLAADPVLAARQRTKG